MSGRPAALRLLGAAAALAAGATAALVAALLVVHAL
jgi:hypothetical protein